MSGCKFYNTIQYNTIQYKPLIYNFWLFFHCKNKKLLQTFKHFLLRKQINNIKDVLYTKNKKLFFNISFKLLYLEIFNRLKTPIKNKIFYKQRMGLWQR